MNSPFTVTAEAVAARPGVRVDHVAKQQKRAFKRNLSELKSGRVPRAWSGPRVRETVAKVVARNRTSIGSTRIDEGLKTEKPVVITSVEADLAAVAVAAPQLAHMRTREQVGSVEGKLVQVATHYNQPAIQVVERKTSQEIWCVVPPAFQHEIAEHTSVEDVWKGSRVVVRGKIYYGSDGRISRVEATDVQRTEPRFVPEEELVDRSFTGGLSVTEYLQKLREGTLG